MWFDSHCHLHICEEEGASASDLMSRARTAGVTDVVTVGIDLDSSERSIAIAANESVYATVGVHPNSSSEWNGASAERVEELARSARVVAIGETGIDFYRDYSPRDIQLNAFQDHLDIAKRLDKAVVIHTRESLDVALELLAEVGAPQRFVFHCWSGTKDQLDSALGLGAFISFAGNVSFPSAEELRAVARSVPHDKLLVETDSPYLTPVPHRGRRNEPRNVAFVGDALANAIDVDTHELAERTSDNARVLFGLA